MQDFLLFLVVGFLAQAVDGALGMAYGVISATALLAFGVTPAHASAAVHAAELFATAASGSSHLSHRGTLIALLAAGRRPGSSAISDGRRPSGP